MPACPPAAPGGHPGQRQSAASDKHAAARICFAAHGRQIVISSAVRAAVIESLADGVGLRSLGAWRFCGLPEPVDLFRGRG